MEVTNQGGLPCDVKIVFFLVSKKRVEVDFGSPPAFDPSSEAAGETI